MPQAECKMQQLPRAGVVLFCFPIRFNPVLFLSRSSFSECSFATPAHSPLWLSPQQSNQVTLADLENWKEK